MPSSTQAGPSSKSPLQHEWTFEQIYNLLDRILATPKYTYNFFPTPGHNPASKILQRYAWTICMIVLKDTAWMEGMKEHIEGGILKFGRKWVGDDPVTTRLKELPQMAVHYEERLGGFTRQEDIPAGSEYAKRWRKYERCPERKWVLKYFALKRIQSDNSMMLDPNSLLEVASNTSTPAPARKKHAEGGDHASASKKGSASKKRTSIRPDPPLPSKCRRPSPNESPTTQTPTGRSNDPEKQREVIYVLDSDDDHLTPNRSKTQETKRMPSPTFVGSDSEEDDDIRSVSPPIITLPSRSFALPPPDSPFRSTIPSPVRLAFQAPIDDTPTDSESEDEDINPPPHTGMGMGMGVFSTISLTTNEDLVGMFTDPKLRPQQAWRNGLPTPPDSRGSGSSSPIKSAGRGWDSALTPEPEAIVQAGTGADMDIETSLDHDSPERLDPVRPMTPPLPPATIGPNRSLAIQEYPTIARISHTQPGIPSYIDLSDDHRTTTPLPTHSIEQSAQPQSVSHNSEDDDMFHNPTDAGRKIAARLLRTLTGDNQTLHEDITTSVEQYPQLPVHGETGAGALSDWIASHTGSPVTTGNPAGRKGREKRPLLERMAPGIHKGKGKQVETTTNRDPQVHDTNIEGIAYSAGTTSKTNSTSRTQPNLPGPSATPSMDATSIHKATLQVTSSILDILIAQTHLTSSHHLPGYVIAFAAGHIPFKSKLGELIIALGGVVLEEFQVREMRSRRYIIHPIGEGGAGTVDDGLEEVDVVGFLEIVGAKIRGSS